MLLLLLLAIIVIILVIVSVTYFVSKLTLGRCTSPVCLIGKTALVTGGNSGIGFQTALALAGRGCRVIIADKVDSKKAVAKIIEETGNANIVGKYFDLASLKSVRKLANDINETETRLDILINNAGTAGLGNSKTEDGLHIGMQVNHFGPFLLTHLLVGLLKKSAPSRIIFVSSVGAYFSILNRKSLNLSTKRHANAASEIIVYCNSKLCSVISSDIFAEKLKEDGVTSNSLHPGIVYTQIFKNLGLGVIKSKLLNRMFNFLVYSVLGFFFKTAEEGAQTTIHLAVAKEVESMTGRFFVDCQPFFLKPFSALNKKFARTIWKLSEDYVELSPEEKL